MNSVPEVVICEVLPESDVLLLCAYARALLIAEALLRSLTSMLKYLWVALHRSGLLRLLRCLIKYVNGLSHSLLGDGARICRYCCGHNNEPD